MSIQHLTNPTNTEQKLNINCGDVQCSNVLGAIVNCDEITTSTITSNNIYTDSVITGSISSNSFSSDTITINKLTLTENLMLYNATKAQAKVIGWQNIIIGEDTIFKAISSQDTTTHFVKKYTYRCGWLTPSSTNFINVVFQLEPSDFAYTLAGKGYEFKLDSTVPVAGNTGVYFGVVSYDTPPNGQVSASIVFTPNIGANDQGTLYLEFYMVKAK
jgi:hypothetical protein